MGKGSKILPLLSILAKLGCYRIYLDKRFFALFAPRYSYKLFVRFMRNFTPRILVVDDDLSNLLLLEELLLSEGYVPLLTASGLQTL